VQRRIRVEEVALPVEAVVESDEDALGVRERLAVPRGAADVLEPRQRPEVALPVPVERRLFTQPPVRRIGIVVEGERVVLHGLRVNRRAPH
jgi:hypothetical protein